MDRGASGITSGYTDEEFLRLQDSLLKKHEGHYPSRFKALYCALRLMNCSLTADWQNLRTRLDILLGHFLVTRGETRRAAELAGLSLLQWPKHHGPTPCFAVVMKMSNGKTNKFGKIEYMGAMRHKDPVLCTMGASVRISPA